MINPPQVLPEEPTAVTPHGGFCGGKSQQWLRYPTKPHVRFWAGCGNGAMVEPPNIRHRQTKGAETDMPGLPPPRHIPTLPSRAIPGRASKIVGPAAKRTFRFVSPAASSPSSRATGNLMPA